MSAAAGSTVLLELSGRHVVLVFEKKQKQPKRKKQKHFKVQAKKNKNISNQKKQKHFKPKKPKSDTEFNVEPKIRQHTLEL